ncbi:MAG: phage integrase N-terminal SAM-like domain-containing protein [Candidatus Rokubacteria bacterium]|nr:phage integrase N-terminal SAM-like domain-containing protein [Candidatus Rokubacteria bacterium]
MEISNVRSLIDRRLSVVSLNGRPAVAISPPAGAPKLKLLDRVRQAMRARHLSPRTEEAYIGWIKRFIFFHGKRHPADMGEAEIGRFLSSLASDSHVAASTQNQALNALLFLYRGVLDKEIGLIHGVVRAKGPRRLPVVLTREEVRRVLGSVAGGPSRGREGASSQAPPRRQTAAR